MKHRTLPIAALFSLVQFFVPLPSVAPVHPATANAAEPLRLHLRSRDETAAGSGQFQVVAGEAEWDPARTAIVVCDMWDQHWCRG
ncbi:MAG TPA: hypothetical protein VND64_03450, partial [Pirellulales bacterium]|nr:hypothetical protein [Pirellulales bacterium]